MIFGYLVTLRIDENIFTHLFNQPKPTERYQHLLSKRVRQSILSAPCGTCRNPAAHVSLSSVFNCQRTDTTKCPINPNPKAQTANPKQPKGSSQIRFSRAHSATASGAPPSLIGVIDTLKSQVNSILKQIKLFSKLFANPPKTRRKIAPKQPKNPAKTPRFQNLEQTRGRNKSCAKLYAKVERSVNIMRRGAFGRAVATV